ncbi:MAG: L-2-hydroxyglutarate oxidase [Acidobacteriota bacterium]|nr:L-2-hydroxyglutarate oxidase [Acidobacteriota bacterium]
MSRNTSDFVVVGAGVVGLTIAREIARRRLGSVVVLEKERALGLHASGRNSGVLHAGLYYAAGTLKARLCSEGARRMRAYAEEHGVRVKTTGKVIVATSEETAPQIDAVHERARASGLRVEKIDGRRLAEIEPEAVSHGDALYSPETAVIDAGGVLHALSAELPAIGARVELAARVRRVDARRRRVEWTGGALSYGHLVNAAGLHADRLAHAMGVGGHLRIVPFKGRYRVLREDAANRIRGSIYPAPDLSMPFLGAHLTRTIDEEVEAGPTATPALGRESYEGLAGVRFRELPSIALALASLYARNAQGFRRLVHGELPHLRREGLARAVAALAPRLVRDDLLPEGRVGIRAQLVDTRAMRLVMDFVVEPGPGSTHVLNAVSPAFTASLAFAEHVVDGIQRTA